jgi:hypothetical protein
MKSPLRSVSTRRTAEARTIRPHPSRTDRAAAPGDLDIIAGRRRPADRVDRHPVRHIAVGHEQDPFLPPRRHGLAARQPPYRHGHEGGEQQIGHRVLAIFVHEPIERPAIAIALAPQRIDAEPDRDHAGDMDRRQRHRRRGMGEHRPAPCDARRADPGHQPADRGEQRHPHGDAAQLPEPDMGRPLDQAGPGEIGARALDVREGLDQHESQERQGEQRELAPTLAARPAHPCRPAASPSSIPAPGAAR